MFTRVTMATAGAWIVLCMLSIWFLGSQDEWGTSSRTRPAGGTSAPAVLPEREEPAGTMAPAPGGGPASPSTTAGDAGGAGETAAAPGGGSGASPDDSAVPAAPRAKE
jgi:hypothetical protein